MIARPKKSGHEKMEYSVISKKSSQFIALTSLQVEEFEWEEIIKDGWFEPAIGENVVDMGVRGMKVLVK